MAAKIVRANLILADRAIDAICEALGIPANHTSEVILHLVAGKPIIAEVTMVGTEDFNVVNWAVAFKGAKLEDLEDI